MNGLMIILHIVAALVYLPGLFVTIPLHLVLSILAGQRSPTQDPKDNELLIAVQGGNSAMVKQWLDKGSSPNAAYHKGNPALIVAIENGNTEIIQILLSAGANPNSKNKIGETALMIAAKGGNCVLVNQLLDKGASPNMQGHVGWTALAEAANGGHIEVVKILLAAGANPNPKLVVGTTILMMANPWYSFLQSQEKRARKEEIAHLLRKAGAK